MNRILPAVAWVNTPNCSSTRLNGLNVKSYDSLDQFLADKVSHFELIVIGQQSYDEHSQWQISQLIASVPLAEVVVVCSVWAVGAPRTRPHWPLAWLVPEWQADERIRQTVQSIERGKPRIPPTATYQKGFERGFGAAHSTGSLSHLCIKPISADCAYRHYLHDWLSSLEMGQKQEPDLVLYDVDLAETHNQESDQMFSLPWIAISGEANWRQLEVHKHANRPVACWHKLSAITHWEADLSRIAEEFSLL